LTPATDSVATTPEASDQNTASAPAAPAGAKSAENTNPPDPMAPIPQGGYFVQVAAVSKQEDADSLVDALKQKQYPAFVASGSSPDKLFRVQMGPFSDIKEAEAMRTRLINDGYNPILKK
jgi:DedD protein